MTARFAQVALAAAITATAGPSILGATDILGDEGCLHAPIPAEEMRVHMDAAGETPAALGTEMGVGHEYILVIWVNRNTGAFTITRSDADSGATCAIAIGHHFAIARTGTPA